MLELIPKGTTFRTHFPLKDSTVSLQNLHATEKSLEHPDPLDSSKNLSN